MREERSPSPWVAGILSALWPGAGQIYVGETSLGRKLALAYLLLVGYLLLVPRPQDPDQLYHVPSLSALAGIAWVFSLGVVVFLWLYAVGSAIATARDQAWNRQRRAIYGTSSEPAAPSASPPSPPVPAPNVGTGTAATLRECCFFCSRVLPPRERHHVEVSIGGHRRVVSACHRHRSEIEGRREPLIRGEETTSGVVPWFVVPFFDPYSQYRPVYGVGIAPSLLPSDYLQAAINLSQPVGLQGWHYADDDWDPGYRTTYWDRHDRWERSQDWGYVDYDPTYSPVSSTAPETSFAEAAGRAAPETSFGMGRAPEQSFSGGPTAAETAFAQSFSQGGASSSTGGGADRS